MSRFDNVEKKQGFDVKYAHWLKYKDLDFPKETGFAAPEPDSHQIIGFQLSLVENLFPCKNLADHARKHICCPLGLPINCI